MTIAYRHWFRSLTLTHTEAFMKGCMYDRQQYLCVLCTVLLSVHWGHAATVFNYNSITLNPTMGEFSFVSRSMVRQMESWSSEPPLRVHAVWIKVGWVKASVYCERRKPVACVGRWAHREMAWRLGFSRWVLKEAHRMQSHDPRVVKNEAMDRLFWSASIHTQILHRDTDVVYNLFPGIAVRDVANFRILFR